MRETVRHLLFRHLPVVLWTGVVALALGLPGGAVASWSDRLWLPWVDPHLDKVVHFVLFAVMAALAARSFAVLSSPHFGLRAATRRPLATGFLLACAYGGIAELAQRWLGERSADLLDFLADVAGAALAVGLMALRRRSGAAGRPGRTAPPRGLG